MQVFKEKVSSLRGVTEFLTLGCGFVDAELPVDGEEKIEVFFVLPPDLAEDTEKLKLMIEFLDEAEPLKLTLDRSIRVFKPGSSPGRIELPPAFFSVSAAEVKREQQNMAEAVEKSKQLRTKAMREVDSSQEKRKYRFSVIRVRFPDGYLLQGTFYSRETLGDIIKLVSESMNDICPLFALVTSTGEKLTDYSKTIESLGLAPAAVLNFLPDESLGAVNVGPEGYVQQELLSRLESL